MTHADCSKGAEVFSKIAQKYLMQDDGFLSFNSVHYPSSLIAGSAAKFGDTPKLLYFT